MPPTWLARGDAEYTQWVNDIKSAETFHSNFEVWESRYSDPYYLSQLTLGQFGSEVELGLHDWLHMRWASVPRDPQTVRQYPWLVRRMIFPRAGTVLRMIFWAIRFPPT